MFNQFKTSKLITKLAEICFLQKFIHTSAEGVYSAPINVMFKQSYFEDVYETKFHFSVSIKINIVYELNQPKLMWQRDQIIRWILAPTSHIIWCPFPLLHTHTSLIPSVLLSCSLTMNTCCYQAFTRSRKCGTFNVSNMKFNS